MVLLVSKDQRIRALVLGRGLINSGPRAAISLRYRFLRSTRVPTTIVIGTITIIISIAIGPVPRIAWRRRVVQCHRKMFRFANILWRWLTGGDKIISCRTDNDFLFTIWNLLVSHGNGCGARLPILLVWLSFGSRI
jgi:hypothetical protein